MKTSNIYQHLELQYKKLNQKIASSKFYQYTQFKQQQLINRLNRCSLQLKHLGMGVGVCVALGVGTPAVGQVPTYMKHIGATNPVDSIKMSADYRSFLKFVDLDGDGDLDMFTLEDTVVLYNTSKLLYHENIGSTSQPLYNTQPSINPFPITYHLGTLPEFADLDGDGDLDAFLMGFGYYSGLPTCMYFENQGTSTVPNFVQKTGTQNPLDTLNSMIPPAQSNIPFFITSGDIDGDGDIDFWFQKIWGQPKEVFFFRNYSNTNNIILALQPLGVDPLTFPTNTLNYRIQLIDIDKDGDLDAFSADNMLLPVFYKNNGTSTNPAFSQTPTTPSFLDAYDNSSFAADTIITNFTIVDLDNDNDYDIVGREGVMGMGSPYEFVFYENLTFTGIDKFVEEAASFMVYPNPTTGKLTFEKPITGSSVLYNNIGQKVLEQAMDNQQELNISELDNGIYFLFIETDKERLRKKIIVQK